MRIDARSQRRRKGERGAVGADHICLKCNADLVQRASQPATCLLTIRLRPQQTCHELAANGFANISNVGKQPYALAQRKVDLMSVEARGGKSKEFKLYSWHRE